MQMRDSGLWSVWEIIWLVIYCFLVDQDFSGGRRIQGMVRILWVNICMGIISSVLLFIIGQIHWGISNIGCCFMLL